MGECWQEEPQFRPSFAQIAAQLESILHDQDNDSNNALVDQMRGTLPDVIARPPPGEKC